jgi:TetR/AcrR family transcriptional regulator
MAKAKGHSAEPTRRLPAEVRRQRLLAVARQSFVANGLAGASMRQIAGQAEVDPALLYRHFPSKQHLFEAAVVEPLEQLAGQLFEAGEGILRSPVEEKPVYLRTGVSLLLEAMNEIAPLMATALFSDQEFGRTLYNERVVPLLHSIAKAVEEDLRSWASGPVDSELMVTAVFTMCFGLAMDREFRSRPLDADYVGARIAELLIHGLMGVPASGR